METKKETIPAAETPLPEKEKEPKATQSIVDEANAAAQRMEEANKKQEELINRQEAIQVEKTLGGQADAGSKEMSEEDKITEEAKKALEGTGYETMFDEPEKK